jgi:hypothetical protein
MGEEQPRFSPRFPSWRPRKRCRSEGMLLLFLFFSSFLYFLLLLCFVISLVRFSIFLGEAWVGRHRADSGQELGKKCAAIVYKG